MCPSVPPGENRLHAEHHWDFDHQFRHQHLGIRHVRHGQLPRLGQHDQHQTLSDGGQNKRWSKIFLYSTTQYLTVKTSAYAFHQDCVEENTNTKIYLEWNKQNFFKLWRKISDPIMWRSRRIKTLFRAFKRREEVTLNLRSCSRKTGREWKVTGDLLTKLKVKEPK